jgi:hypothetical protein
MKFLLATMTLVCLLSYFLLSHKSVITSPRFGVDTPSDIHAPQDVPPANTSVTSNADRREQLERAIKLGVRRERRWMLFVGLTLIGYRLFRKHQSLFENSVLYPGYEGLERSSAGNSRELEEFPDFVQSASRARG